MSSATEQNSFIDFPPATAAIESSIFSTDNELITSRINRTLSAIISPNVSDASLSLRVEDESERTKILSCTYRPLDLTDLSRATAPVEQSVVFPVIEWISDCEENEISQVDVSMPAPRSLHELEADEDDDDDDPIYFRLGSSGKRRFGGARTLLRSKSHKSGLNCMASFNSVPKTQQSPSDSVSILYGPASAALDRKLGLISSPPYHVIDAEFSFKLSSLEESWGNFIIPSFAELTEGCDVRYSASPAIMLDGSLNSRRVSYLAE